MTHVHTRGLRTLAALIAVLALTLTAMVSTVSAAHDIDVDDYTLGEGFENPCSGESFKLNSTYLAEGTHTYIFGDTGLEVELTVVMDGSEVDSATVVSVVGGSFNAIYVHAGEGTTLQLVAGMVIDPEKGISFILFCAAPPSPTLSLEKVVTGAGASQSQEFSFTTDLGPAVMVAAEDTALQVATTAGAHTITENLPLPTGYTLSSISCDSDVAPTVDVAARSVTVTVGADEDVVCTFTNAFTPPSITLTPTLSLEKAVAGAAQDTTEFPFALGAVAIPGATASEADAPVLLASAAGTYVIAEGTVANWNLTGIDCTGNAVAETVTMGTSSVSVTVGADEDVVCTFTNAPSGTLAGNPTPTPSASPVVRSGTLAGALPNTAMESGSFDGTPAVLLAIIGLAGLAYVGRRNLMATGQRS